MTLTFNEQVLADLLEQRKLGIKIPDRAFASAQDYTDETMIEAQETGMTVRDTAHLLIALG